MYMYNKINKIKCNKVGNDLFFYPQNVCTKIALFPYE